MASSSKNQTNSCSNLSSKVRIVAKIRGFRDDELATTSMSVISVRKSDEGLPSEKFAVSVEDETKSRKNAYEVDHCYDQDGDTALIFSKEIKPQIMKVFDGENATIIAFGARGSGKTYMIQGSKENLGLGVLAMDEILKIAEERKQEVAVSLYEVFHDHVYDLLDSRRPEVQVFEDAQGKRTLKGLSKVTVKSILEFQKLYVGESGSIKPSQKVTLEPPRRSHKALMIHILTCEENSTPKLAGKMNFVDLAGYENARKNGIDGTNFVESTRINKSLNALLNVIHALNANENRVPYRESKLTRMLQDSLSGNNHVLMLICLNPLFCLDTVHVINLAARLKSVKPVSVCATAKKQTSSRLPLSASMAKSVVAVCSTTKNQTSSRLPSSAKRVNPVLKGRKLFDDTDQSVSSKQRKNPSTMVNSVNPDDDSAVVYSSQGEVNCSSDIGLVKQDIVDVASAVVPNSLDEELTVSGVVPEMQSLTLKKEDPLSVVESNAIENIPVIKDESKTSVITNGSDNIDKENSSLLMNKDPSPPLSVKLKELTDNLKALCTPTNISIDMPQEYGSQLVCYVDNTEPKTPIVARDMNMSGKMNITNFKSPSGLFNERSSGMMKQTLIQEYLQFLNTAGKEELKGLRDIGEKRAAYILERREESPEPFKSLDDLQEIGLTEKQVKRMMKNVAGQLFN